MIEVEMDHASRTGAALKRALEDGGDLKGIVNWTGAPMRGAENFLLPILNAESRTNKLEQLRQLAAAGVKVPQFDLHAIGPDWLGRTVNHQQGRDFTRAPFHPDYFVQRLYYDDEWRVHVVKTPKGNYRVLRSGLKIPNRRGFHPWVRSHRLGWKISYCGGAPEATKEEARKAVAALQLDFAAVDIANTTPAPTVLEVNTCPGLDTGTLAYYVAALKERFQ